MSPAASASPQMAASWNQHSAPPLAAPLCRNSSGALSDAASGLGAGVATCVASSHTSTPAPACCAGSPRGCGGGSARWSARSAAAPGNSTRRLVPAVLSAASTAVPPMLSSVLAAVELCRQLGRDQTRNSVQAVPEPSGHRGADQALVRVHERAVAGRTCGKRRRHHHVAARPAQQSVQMPGGDRRRGAAAGLMPDRQRGSGARTCRPGRRPGRRTRSAACRRGREDRSPRRRPTSPAGRRSRSGSWWRRWSGRCTAAAPRARAGPAPPSRCCFLSQSEARSSLRPAGWRPEKRCFGRRHSAGQCFDGSGAFGPMVGEHLAVPSIGATAPAVGRVRRVF